VKAHTSTGGCELDRASAAESGSKGFVDSSNGFDGDIGVIAGVTNTYHHKAANTFKMNANVSDVSINNCTRLQKEIKLK